MEPKTLEPDKAIATIEGWEDGQPFSRHIYKLDRWQLQAADRITIHIGQHDLVLLQDPHSEHLGGYVWLTSIVLCSYLEAISLKPTRRDWITLDWNKRWVELGSGVGLIGIMLRKLGIEQVVITDIDALVPIMERNVQANGFHVRSISGRCTNDPNADAIVVEPLVWNDQEAIQRVSDCGDLGYIVACDCIYSEASAIDLVATMNLLANDDTIIICASELRNTAAQQRFVVEAKKFFDLDLVPAAAWQNRIGNIVFDETLNLYRLRKKLDKRRD